MLELLSKFDPFLADHLYNHANKDIGHVSYLSAPICDEFIAIMEHQVLSQIISELEKAKYYSISVDSTPDISHIDQLTFVVRYMMDCSPIERFLDFIPIERHGVEYVSASAVFFLEENGIDLQDCRGQTYDSAPNMAGQYNGLQAKLKEHCTCALFVWHTA
ncbi:zinc finger MYM-type protein 1-like [Leptinotarsa decemlineata]|uniref:zinc finger MYM-type protein 1-like n=1 Tax=Leptinotarsa decemlineata TaxID=7539 RepID=UPI003D307405